MELVLSSKEARYKCNCLSRNPGIGGIACRSTLNSTYKVDLFPLPEAKLDVAAVVPGIDGKKMSKSYGNTIDIFAEGKPLKKVVMSIVTDSTPLEAPKDPDKCNVFALYSLFASNAETYFSGVNE